MESGDNVEHKSLSLLTNGWPPRDGVEPRSGHQGPEELFLGVEKSPLAGHINYPVKEIYFKLLFTEDSL